MGITVEALRNLRPGQWVSDGAGRGGPSLRAKGSPTGIPRFYLRYRDAGGRFVDLPINAFKPTRTGLDLAEAEARGLSARWHNGAVNLRAVLEAEEAARIEQEGRQREVDAARRLADAARSLATAGGLCEAYADHLVRNGKVSADSVRKALRRYVGPTDCWGRPAADFTADDAASLMRRLEDEGKRRAAAMLRSHLRAAFTLAAESHQAGSDADFRIFAIQQSPLVTLRKVKGGNKPRERVLSAAELRAYWRRICDLAEPAGALLRLHLMTGAQRIAQLSRVRVQDYDGDRQMLTLRDPKGRREIARKHEVPVIPAARKAMLILARGTGDYISSTDGGASPANYYAVAHRLRPVVEAMVAAREVVGPFTLGDLRRTVETRLQEIDVPTEVRAHLQSHGLGGVQTRHYAHHTYTNEKRGALGKLHRLVCGRLLPRATGGLRRG